MATNPEVLESVRLKAAEWLTDVYDEATKAEVRRMLANGDTTEFASILLTSALVAS